ncbi:MAG: DedA family protein [Burkholderiaceae bacterium]|jgi:membrane-associated protein
MSTIALFADFFLHIDKYLALLTVQYGALIYLVLFGIVFAETGLVVTPFLPGDSLLFVAGALAGLGQMNPWLLTLVLIAAAVLGNTVNYHIGRWLGPKVFDRESRWLDRAALQKTHTFYERHGGKTVVLSRFLPILRTFAPFVAGISHMNYVRFQLYNVTGACIWVMSLVAAGYFFGNLPWVARNLNSIVLVGVCAAVVPAAGAALWRIIRR